MATNYISIYCDIFELSRGVAIEGVPGYSSRGIFADNRLEAV